ncbi:hypothetical protein [Parapedobacter tibetensis]|uniref:hypothetical protein n=1 Tax=Parapedobacter tibetensis TaxID=2972951 RepID=UPI00214D9A99|nr:hypothetical protein [Parapedobacter tibetensis]
MPSTTSGISIYPIFLSTHAWLYEVFAVLVPMHFDSIEYLRYGSPRQRAAYDALTAHGIMDKLRDYLPILGVSLDDD